SLFNKKGMIHIIVAYPFDEKSWRAYNWRGEEIEVKVVD
ncbi:MAG: peptidase, partial [Thermoplasmata archaeon]